MLFCAAVWPSRLQSTERPARLKSSSDTCLSVALSQFLTIVVSEFPHLKNRELIIVLKGNLVNTDKLIRSVPGTQNNLQ